MTRSPIALLSACLAASAIAQAAPVAKVNGVAIPEQHLEFMVKQNLARAGGDEQKLRDAVREDLINRQVIIQEAERSGLMKRPEVIIQLEMSRQAAIIQSYILDWLSKNPVTDDDVRTAYDDAKKAAGDTEYRARHILLSNESDAKNLVTKLLDGADFERAATVSRDAGSRERGGDLGWIRPNPFVKPLTDALAELKKGEIARSPVRTRNGFHVIRLDDIRPIQFPTYEQASNSLRQQLIQQKTEKLIRRMRDGAKIE